jgi:SAM-dependent methyltransferase
MTYYFMLFLEILLGLISLLLITGGCMLLLTFFFGPPFLPTPMSVIKELIQIANITKKDVVIDLGSGDGRMLIHAARQGATARGWEINPFLVLWTRLVMLRYRVGERVKVYLQNYYKADLSDATVVFLYHLPLHMPKLERKLQKDLKKGTRIISYKFTLPTLKLTATPRPGIFIYTI